MGYRRVEAGRGFAWYGEGWRLFMLDPGTWIVFAVLLIVLVVLLNTVPVLGPLLFSLIAPGLAGGLLYAAREISMQRKMEFNQLFVAFREPALRNPMLRLGAVLIGANLLLVLLGLLIIGGGLGLAGTVMEPGNHMMGARFGIGLLLAMLLMMAVGLLVAMAFLYAIPLVMFADAGPGAAMKASFGAGLANILPLSLFGIVYVVLAVLAAIPAGLGFLLLLPVSFGALYASYRDIFEPPPVS